MKTIKCNINDKDYEIPNCWEILTPEQFVFLAGLLSDYAQRKISVADVKLKYVIYILNINMDYIPDKHREIIFQNLYVLMSNVTFIFNIKYDSEIWKQLSPELKKQALKTEPIFLPSSPEVRILRSKPYDFVVDAVFACQLLPTITIKDNSYKAYSINTDADQLSTSLTAKQYVDASEELKRINEGNGSLAMLAAILYSPLPYSSDAAHGNVKYFQKHLHKDTLEAIALNFQAFMLFLFQRTHYSLLWRRPKQGTAQSRYSVGLVKGLYNLSADGYGDLNTVYNYSAIEYLELLYSKLIDSVKMMRSGGMADAEIADKTELDINIVMEIQ